MHQVDGVGIDRWTARFTGSASEVDPEEFSFGRMVVMVVVGTVHHGQQKPKDDGEVVAQKIITVTDFARLDGDLRDQAIAYIAHGSDQGVLNFGQPRHPEPPKIKGQGSLPVADYADPGDDEADEEPPPGVDANGEVQPVHTPPSKARVIQDPDDEFDVPPAEPEPVTSRPGDVEPPAYVPPAEPTATKDAAPAPTGQVVGSVRQGPRKDEALAAFLNED